MAGAHRRLRRHRLHRAGWSPSASPARASGRCWPAAREARLATLAERLGGLEIAHGDVDAPELGVRAGRARATCSSPPSARSSKWGEPAVRAAIAGRARPTSTRPASRPFIRRVFEEHGPTARAAGAPLLTAMGYDFVPGALAGALALEEAGEDAVRVDVGYYALGMATAERRAPARARRWSGATLDESHAFRDGALRNVRTGRARALVPGQGQGARRRLGRRRRAPRRCPAAYPQLREVNVYLGWFGPLARADAGGRAGRLGRHAAARACARR